MGGQINNASSPRQIETGAVPPARRDVGEGHGTRGFRVGSILWLFFPKEERAYNLCARFRGLGEVNHASHLALCSMVLTSLGV